MNALTVIFTFTQTKRLEKEIIKDNKTENTP
jgi:hypothetical protein